MRAFFEAPLSHEPGTFFAYNTAASYLAAELVRRAAGRTVPELLARTVFPALGVEEFSWLTCADGRCQGGTGLQASCDDVAKLALLYLNEGEWAGRRVLPREWVHMAAQPHSVNAGNGTPDWCAGYGYQFWMNRRGGFRGDGAFGRVNGRGSPPPGPRGRGRGRSCCEGSGASGQGPGPSRGASAKAGRPRSSEGRGGPGWRSPPRSGPRRWPR